MAARACEFAEAVRAALEAAWPTEETPPTFVVDDDWDVETIDELNEIVGRWVVVSDETYSQIEAASRSEDVEEYAIAVAFLERYTGTSDTLGKVPKAWKEERKRLVQDNLYRYLNNHRENVIVPGAWTETCEVSVVMDRELMRKSRVFVSVVEVTYREIRRVTS